MSGAVVLLLLIFTQTFSYGAVTNLNLSPSIYNKVPFSSEFIEDGALIKSVNYTAVRALLPQIEKHYWIKLEDRGEAHITVLTPPEAQGWFTDHKGINFLISAVEIQQKYFSTLQEIPFQVVCVGKQKNDANGNLVFYLVVKAPQLFDVRNEIQKELESRAIFTGMKTYFNANEYYPHITIGYVGGDVHGVSKAQETCDPNLSLSVK